LELGIWELLNIQGTDAWFTSGQPQEFSNRLIPNSQFRNMRMLTGAGNLNNLATA